MDKTMLLRRASRVAIACLIIAASGCFQPAPDPLTGIEPPTNASYLPVAGMPSGTGQLRIEIKWPGRSTQGIPLSARKLKFRLKQGAAEKAYREVDQTTTTTAFILRAGAYDLEVGAHPDAVGYESTEIAGATSSVVIYSSVVTSAGLALEPKFQPALDPFDEDSLVAGQNITLPGSNLALGWSPGLPVVTFPKEGGGTTQASVTVGPGGLSFSVPLDAETAGDFTVTLDGITRTYPYTQGAAMLTVSQGSFTLQADDSNGVTRTAPAGQGGINASYTSSGSWKDCALCQTTNANGYGTAGSGAPLPTLNRMALVVRRGGGSYQIVGISKTFTATSGESLVFKTNDCCFGNNSGSQTISFKYKWKKTGSFTVNADSSTGTAFQAPPISDLSCQFAVLGNQQWSYVSGGSADLDANGTPVDSGGTPTGVPVTAADSTYTFPSGNAGALIVKRGDDSYEPAGKDRSIAVNSGEVLRLLINDVTTGYGSNPGSLAMNFACNTATFGNANVTVQ